MSALTLVERLRKYERSTLLTKELRDTLTEARKIIQAPSSETNDYGMQPCPKCHSASGPHPYWWQRGQAWLVICSDCKHETGRESSEGLARDVWNLEARDVIANAALDEPHA